MMKDIECAEDIKLLVDSFYEKVRADEVIGFIFNEVAHVNWDEHLPVMYRFWATTLLGETTFAGNPMEKHMHLNKLLPLTKAHFDRWLQLWKATITQHFSGRKAEEAKSRGTSIAELMLFKISNQAKPHLM